MLLPWVKILRENFYSLEPKYPMLNIWKMCYNLVSDNLGSTDTSFRVLYPCHIGHFML